MTLRKLQTKMELFRKESVTDNDGFETEQLVKVKNVWCGVLQKKELLINFLDNVKPNNSIQILIRKQSIEVDDVFIYQNKLYNIATMTEKENNYLTVDLVEVK